MRSQLVEAALERSYQKSPRRSTRSPSLVGSTAPPTTASSSSSSSSSSGSASPHDAEPKTAAIAPANQFRPRRRSQLSRQSISVSSDSTLQTTSSSQASSDAVKIILLGAGESGKSTIAKQMKLLHGGGYSHAELVAFRPQVLRNVVEAMQQVLFAMQRLGLDFGGAQRLQSQEYAEYVMGLRLQWEMLDCLPAAVVDAVSFLWNESGIRRNMADLTHASFFDNVDRFARPDFCPTTTDVLRARTKTTGIHRTAFRCGSMAIDMYDVGGQRTERRRWVQIFESVTTVIFCVALSEYDQALAEDPRQNRLLESFQLFDNIVNSPWFRQHSSVVLFLNKSDVFREKLASIPLADYFPDFTGGGNFEAAVEFVRDRFLRLNRSAVPVYAFLTCATDSQNILAVFEAVRETVLRNVLVDSGLI